MTPSAEHTPTSPTAHAESASGGEKTTVTASAVTAAHAEPETEPAETKTGADTGTKAAVTGTGTRVAEAGTGTKAAEGEEKTTEGTTTEGTTTEGKATQGKTTEAGTASDTRSETETEADTETESGSETDPGAAAAAKSRLPALVRTMTVTAIDRPQQRTAPVGRPGRAVLAGAAVAGAVLVSVPFLVLGGDDDKAPKTSAAAGTVLGGSSEDAPGDFVVTSPDTGASGDSEKNSGKPEKPVREAPASASAPAPAQNKDKSEAEDQPKQDSGQSGRPKKPSGGTKAGGGNNQPAKAGSGLTLSSPVSLHSHLSGRCIDVPDADFGDGRKLHVWDCNNSEAQQWRFASDGTIRIKDKCLDVANANFNDGTPIQIAWCNGNNAQKFVLNASHDLVNTVVGKCVDIKDNNRDNGASLQLWSCAGTDNQKWSV
ncbi:ricin-type beta-trefoil lectin domain protein [Streptomyces sp. NPDC050287]|uniref:ricin-type beta-trefoil lectin domain protein n=1 Tax=Streptomyces sp. NPDC050287 TaxID=3365608 RepID=UPI003794EF41